MWVFCIHKELLIHDTGKENENENEQQQQQQQPQTKIDLNYSHLISGSFFCLEFSGNDKSSRLL